MASRPARGALSPRDDYSSHHFSDSTRGHLRSWLPPTRSADVLRIVPTLTPLGRRPRRTRNREPPSLWYHHARAHLPIWRQHLRVPPRLSRALFVISDRFCGRTDFLIGTAGLALSSCQRIFMVKRPLLCHYTPQGDAISSAFRSASVRKSLAKPVASGVSACAPRATYAWRVWFFNFPRFRAPPVAPKVGLVVPTPADDLSSRSAGRHTQQLVWSKTLRGLIPAQGGKPDRPGCQALRLKHRLSSGSRHQRRVTGLSVS